MTKRKRRKKKGRGSVLYFIIYLAFLLFYAIVLLLPTRFLQKLSMWGGRLAYRFLPDTRRLVLTNLSIAYSGEKTRHEMAEMAKNIFANVILNACEAIKMPAMSESEISRKIEIRGEDILQKTLAMGMGVVGVCSHMGNFIMLQAILARRGYPVNVLVRDPEARKISDFLKERQERLGIAVISRLNVKKAVQECNRWISGKGLLCIYLDQHSSSGIATEFFGKKIKTPSGAAIFARRHNAPVVGIFSYRTADNRNRIVIEGPYPAEKSGNFSRDISVNTSYFMSRVEDYVKRYPEQWFSWLHKRFR